MRGKDTIAQAQSGTGKTATYGIGALQIIEESQLACQALIIVPTRELGYQVQSFLKLIGSKMNLVVHLCVGGTDIRLERKNLEAGCHMVVGTPGRILDAVSRGRLCTKSLKLLIFDEADELLGKGFEEDIQKLIQHLPADIQIGLFSATMPPAILKITKDIMRDPAKILVKNEDLTLEGIKQYYVSFDKEDQKFITLGELFKNLSTPSIPSI